MRTTQFRQTDLEQIQHNQLPVFQLIWNASERIDVLTTNDENLLGLSANVLLAAIRSHVKVRYLRSIEGASSINRTIEKILYRLNGASRMRCACSNRERSIMIIDGTVGLIAHHLSDCTLRYEYVTSPEILDDLGRDYEAQWSQAENGKIRCVRDAIELVRGLTPPRSSFLFRGQSNHLWHAKPKLLRDPESNAHDMELQYIKPLLLRQPYDYTYSYDPVEVFVNRQHYGDSTRLLDFTHDILVALFFACFDRTSQTDDCDGKVYALPRDYFDYLQPLSIFDTPPTEAMRDELARALEGRILNSKILLVDPIIRNPRMRLQDGLFLYFPRFKLQGEYLSIEAFIRERNRKNGDTKAWFAHKLVDKDFKKHILRELREDHGIEEDTLFYTRSRVTYSAPVRNAISPLPNYE